MGSSVGCPRLWLHNQDRSATRRDQSATRRDRSATRKDRDILWLVTKQRALKDQAAARFGETSALNTTQFPEDGLASSLSTKHVFAILWCQPNKSSQLPRYPLRLKWPPASVYIPQLYGWRSGDRFWCLRLFLRNASGRTACRTCIPASLLLLIVWLPRRLPSSVVPKMGWTTSTALSSSSSSYSTSRPVSCFFLFRCATSA